MRVTGPAEEPASLQTERSITTLPARRAGSPSRSAADRRATVVTCIHAGRSNDVAIGGQVGYDLHSLITSWVAKVLGMTYWILGVAVGGMLAVAVACRKQSPAESPVSSAAADGVFVFVRVPEPLQPLDRAAKYEDPLDATLKKTGLGEVTGGGTQMSKPKADGSRDIEWVGIDVELADLDLGIGPLKQELIRLGVPKGTLLEYQRSGKQIEDPVH